MSFFRKLFGSGDDEKSSDKNHDSRSDSPRNVKLITYLNRYANYPSRENYDLTAFELRNGNSFLLLPSKNDAHESSQWRQMEAGEILQLQSVVTIDGMDTLLAFSDEEALLEWSKTQTEYKAVTSKELLDFCLQNRIYRIIINPEQRNMFAIEADIPVTKKKIEKEPGVVLGQPSQPLPNQLIGELVERFSKIPAVEEGFQYMQAIDGDKSLMIGVFANDNSEAAKQGIVACIHNTIHEFGPRNRVGVYFIQSQNIRKIISEIPNALFYSK